MEYEDFRNRLKKLNMSMKEYSILINTSYGTVKRWGKDGRAVPTWVKTWLDLYEENLECKKYKESMQILMSGIKTS